MYADCRVDEPTQQRVRNDSGEDDVMCFADVADGDCLHIVCDNDVYDCDLKVAIGDESTLGIGVVACASMLCLGYGIGYIEL